jgi:hypothetical protein
MMSLAPLEAPPAQLPQATLATGESLQSGAVVASRWPTSGGPVVESPPPAHLRWPTAVMAPPVGGTAVIELTTPSMPARVELRGFAAVDSATGVPDETGIPTICTTLVETGDTCHAERGGTGITISLPAKVSPYLVVYVEWYVPVTFRRPQQAEATWSASYAFHLIVP